MRQTPLTAALGVTFALLLPFETFAQRLPRVALPDHYDLTFELDFDHQNFTAEETIKVRVLEPTADITLNALDLEIHSAQITSGRIRQKGGITLDTKSQMVRLSVDKPIRLGPAEIHIQFTGRLKDRPPGFYVAESDSHMYAISQFEPTDARRVFPCFDEPDYKATYSITLVINKDDTAISNGRLLSDTYESGTTKHTLKFSPSPIMSSYLVALAVGQFQCLEGVADEIPIRVCGPPEEIEQGHYALETAKYFLQYFNGYFGVPYPFHKLDLIAVPGFNGGMENTGAIFFDKAILLASPQDEPPEMVGGPKHVIAHEMAHQWFGDLVTMKWWDDIWLNEGFATWMSFKALEADHPDGSEGINVASEAFFDADVRTPPIHRYAEVPEEIAKLFGFQTAYRKPSTVLRMLEAYEGPAKFRAGINAYLKKYAYVNATGEDFWNTQTEVSKLPINQIMPTFIDQAGAPLISLSGSCENGIESLTLSQRRFFSDRDAFEKSNDQIWRLPVGLKWQDSGGKIHTRYELLKQKQEVFHLLGCPRWIFGNAAAHGYYLVSYDPANLLRLMADACAKLTPPERTVLVVDEWALAKIGKDSITGFMTVAEALRNDQTPQVIRTLLSHLHDIGNSLVTDSNRDLYNVWLRHWLAPQAARLGWQPAPNEGAEQRSLRASILSTLGGVARDPQTLAEAQKLAEGYLADPRLVDSSLTEVALNLAALNGSATYYDELLSHAKATENRDIYRRCLFALASFTDPVLLERTLDFALSPSLRNPKELFDVIPRMMSTSVSRDFTWNLIERHWDEILQKFPSAGSFLIGEAGSFCDSQHETDVNQFFTKHPVRSSDQTLQQTLKAISNCAEFQSEQSSSLSRWLAKENSVVVK